MKCSKCWLWEKGCLDGNHHREVTLMLCDGATRKDALCPAMRAVMWAAGVGSTCPREKMVQKTKVDTYCSRMGCPECVARRATGGK